MTAHERRAGDAPGSMRRLSDIGAAVVGTGFIGVVHIDALRRLGVRVHGIVGSSPARADERARALGLPPAYPSFEAMLDDRRVDVVHVATPNHLHQAQVGAALAAGKHVVCEKPLAMTATESADLLARATRSGLVNAVNFNVRYYPVCRHLRQLVRDGELGDVRLVTGHYLQEWLLLETDWNWRVDPASGGNLRAVGDIGSHWLDLAAFVTGRRVEAVLADLSTFVPARRRPLRSASTFAGDGPDDAGEAETFRVSTEDCATILLRFAGGARGALVLSQISAGHRNDLLLEVNGAAGSAAWRSERPDRLWLGHRGAPNEVLDRGPDTGAAEASERGLPAGHVEGFADTFVALYRAVYADVARGARSSAPTYPTFGDGHRAMLVGEAIAASAADGRWVEVAS